MTLLPTIIQCVPPLALSGFPNTASTFSVLISFRPYIMQPMIATIIAKVMI
jgi:hypothetical protein